MNKYIIGTDHTNKTAVVMKTDKTLITTIKSVDKNFDKLIEAVSKYYNNATIVEENNAVRIKTGSYGYRWTNHDSEKAYYATGGSKRLVDVE